jgi:NitT/TauT family transport system substrate-binding protein
MRLRKHLAMLTVGLMAVGGLAACGDSEDGDTGDGAAKSGQAAVSLSLGFQWQPQWVPLLHGQAEGFFESRQLDATVSPTTGPLQSVQFLSAGKVDFALTDLSTFVTTRAQGATDAKIVYVYLPQPTLGLVSKKPFPTPDSLKGSSFGTVATSSSDQVIEYLLTENGADADSVEIKKLDFAVLYPSLFSGDIDAAEARDPGSWRNLQATALEQKQPLHFTKMSDWGLAGYGYVLIASEKTISEQPDVVRRTVEAVDESLRSARATLTDDEVVELLAKEVEVPNPEAAGLDWQDWKSMTADAGAVDGAVIEAEMQLQERTGQIDEVLDVATTYTNEFVPEQ